MSRAELLLITGSRNEPGEERSVFDQRLPTRDVPVHVLGGRHRCAWLTAEKNNHRVGFGWNETEKEHILRATVVAFEHCVSKRTAGVELYFLVSSADEVIDDVGGGGIATGTAKPLATSKTSDNAARVVNTTVSVIFSVCASQFNSCHEHTRRHAEAVPSLPQVSVDYLRRRLGGLQDSHCRLLPETLTHRHRAAFFSDPWPGSRYSRRGQQSRCHRWH